MKWEKKGNTITIELDNALKKKEGKCFLCKGEHNKRDYGSSAFSKVCETLNIESDEICMKCKQSIMNHFGHNYLNFNKHGEKIKRLALESDKLYSSFFNKEDDFAEEWHEIDAGRFLCVNLEIIEEVAERDECYLEYVGINGLSKIINKTIINKQKGII
jgi:hypothetical protein